MVAGQNDTYQKLEVNRVAEGRAYPWQVVKADTTVDTLPLDLTSVTTASGKAAKEAAIKALLSGRAFVIQPGVTAIAFGLRYPTASAPTGTTKFQLIGFQETDTDFDPVILKIPMSQPATFAGGDGLINFVAPVSANIVVLDSTTRLSQPCQTTGIDTTLISLPFKIKYAILLCMTASATNAATTQVVAKQIASSMIY